MKLIEEFKQIGIVGITIAFIGIMGSLASLLTLGVLGLVISITLALLVAGVCYLILRPVLIKNMRSVTILRAVNTVGIVDFENRDDLKHALPPSKIYEVAKREIVITGISAHRTFDQHISLIHQALAAGKKLYVMILDFDSPDVEVSSKREKKNMRSEILQTITIIKKEGLNQHTGFQIRFMQTLPPFTAVMIDGDISPTGKPLDEEGQIRIQPNTLHSTQHGGIILHFKKTIISYPVGAFNYFAEDLRKQWQDGTEKKQVLES